MATNDHRRHLSKIEVAVEEREAAIDEPTSPAHPIASYPPVVASSAYRNTKRPVKRASGGRAPEFYGFVAWLLTLLVYITYILWALLPDGIIRALGIEWYPAREWSVLIPAWSVVLFLTAYFVYFALGIYGTPALSSISTITDPRAHHPAVQSQGVDAVGSKYYLHFSIPDAVPAPYDLPPALVNQVLYGKRRRSETLARG